jgi:hypothetical protein
MRKPAQFFVASVLAGLTFVCLSASAAAKEQNEWPVSKPVACVSSAATA